MTRRDAHTLALLASLLWIALAAAAGGWAMELHLATPKAALLQWLVAGVLPPALALASMPDERG